MQEASNQFLQLQSRHQRYPCAGNYCPRWDLPRDRPASRHKRGGSLQAQRDCCLPFQARLQGRAGKRLAYWTRLPEVWATCLANHLWASNRAGLRGPQLIFGRLHHLGGAILSGLVGAVRWIFRVTNVLCRRENSPLRVSLVGTRLVETDVLFLEGEK